MARTKYKQPQVKIVETIVYLLELFGKYYIGITTQSLEDRVKAHIREARSSKPYKPDNLPYVEPYDNFKGKKSSINRIFNTKKVDAVIKHLSRTKQNKHVFEIIMSKAKILENVKCEAVYNTHFNKWEVDRTDLELLEGRYINEMWLENPKQLLNYKKIPFNQRFAYKLQEALDEDIEKLRKKGRITDSSDMNEAIKGIKKNRRSSYRKLLTVIKKEVKLLVDGSSDYRRKALEEAQSDDEVNTDF